MPTGPTTAWGFTPASRRQRREWIDQHASASGLALEPVLPVVLYTGSRPWSRPKPLVDHVRGGESFARFLPRFDILFVGLRDITRRDLEERGGFLGVVLELIRDRSVPLGPFQELYRRAVVRLESMPLGDLSRWRELVSYLWTLVYHWRERAELRSLEYILVSSVRSEEHREEVTEMFKSAAQVQLEKGIEKGRQEGEVVVRRATLLRLLRAKFGELPESAVEQIEATSDLVKLDAWLDGVLTAESLESLGL